MFFICIIACSSKPWNLGVCDKCIAVQSFQRFLITSSACEKSCSVGSLHFICSFEDKVSITLNWFLYTSHIKVISESGYLYLLVGIYPQNGQKVVEISIQCCASVFYTTLHSNHHHGMMLPKYHAPPTGTQDHTMLEIQLCFSLVGIPSGISSQRQALSFSMQPLPLWSFIVLQSHQSSV